MDVMMTNMLTSLDCNVKWTITYVYLQFKLQWKNKGQAIEDKKIHPV